MNCDLCAKRGITNTATIKVESILGRNVCLCDNHKGLVIALYAKNIKKLEVESARLYKNNQD